MKVTRRQPRYGYVQVLNAIARDYRLSWRARGLLVELLSYPPGYEITIDELVERGREHGKATEGRDAMRKAARELKTLGYIVATKYQDESGRWHTALEVTDDPMYDLLDRVSAGHTDDWKPVRRSDLGERAFPQVAPTTGKPTVGFSGVNKKTEKKTENSSSPSPLTDARQSQPSHDQEEEEEKINKGKTHTPVADLGVEAAIRHIVDRNIGIDRDGARVIVDSITASMLKRGETVSFWDRYIRRFTDEQLHQRLTDATRARVRGRIITHLPGCGVCNPQRRLEDAEGNDMGPCPTCNPKHPNYQPAATTPADTPAERIAQ